MITRRDQDVFNFLEEFHHATTSQIGRLFFANTSNRYCQHRLEYLTDQELLKRTRSTINNEFAYYMDKKSYLQQIHHDLIRTEVYVRIKRMYEVLDWTNELTIDHIRPEAVFRVNNHGIVFPVFLEIHLHNQFNFEKYKKFVQSNDLYGTLPRVLIVTDRTVVVPQIGIRLKVVGLDMKGLENLFK